MRQNVQKIFEVIGILTVFIFVMYFIFSLINNYNVKVKVNYTPQTKSVVVPDTSVNSSIPPNEGDDVYTQRQLRADYNTGSSSDGY